MRQNAEFFFKMGKGQFFPNQICLKVQRANTPLSLIELSKIIIKRENDNKRL